jgi:hypothetical protein
MDRKLTVISDEQAKGRGIIDRLLDAGTGPDRYLCGKCGKVPAEGLGDPNFVHRRRRFPMQPVPHLQRRQMIDCEHNKKPLGHPRDHLT